MDSLTTGIWVITLALGVGLVVWLWRRSKRDKSLTESRRTVKGKILGWMGAVAQEEFEKGEARIEALQKELTTRLTYVEKGLTHQGRIEDLAVDLRQRLHRLEHSPSQSPTEAPAQERVIPRTVLRLGVRMTLTDLLWKELGIVQPWDLSDAQLGAVFQGPFCRNCLRSLVASVPVEGEKHVRYQCRHCLLSWRVDPTDASMPLRQLKREVYELLDSEYRRFGAVGIRDET